MTTITIERAVLGRIKNLIGGSFWEKPRVNQEVNLNAAWHELDAALTAAEDRPVAGVEQHIAEIERMASQVGARFVRDERKIAIYIDAHPPADPVPVGNIRRMIGERIEDLESANAVLLGTDERSIWRNGREIEWLNSLYAALAASEDRPNEPDGSPDEPKPYRSANIGRQDLKVEIEDRPVAGVEPEEMSDPADNVLEDAAKAAFVKAQYVYRADHDHFPLKYTWETTTESVREGWRGIAYAALEAAQTPPLGTRPINAGAHKSNLYAHANNGPPAAPVPEAGREIADEIDRLRHVEQATDDGEPNNPGDSWNALADYLIEHIPQITAALRPSQPAAVAAGDLEDALENFPFHRGRSGQPAAVAGDEREALLLRLDALTSYLEQIDGKYICSDGGENTFIDEGFFLLDDHASTLKDMRALLVRSTPSQSVALEPGVIWDGEKFVLWKDWPGLEGKT